MGEVTSVELSRHLNIKMPTVNSMMRKLAEKGLVKYESYKPYRLTSEGKKQAALVIRKHRLTEMFLVEKMSFGWEEVHEIAEQIEHIKSPAFFAKMDEILGYPKSDPHGSPIPDKNGEIEWISYRTLGECNVGDKLKIMAVTNSSKEFLNFLNSKDLQLNVEVVVVNKETFDGSIKVKYKGIEETFSQVVAGNLLVK